MDEQSRYKVKEDAPASKFCTKHNGSFYESDCYCAFGGRLGVTLVKVNANGGLVQGAIANVRDERDERMLQAKFERPNSSRR